MVEFAVGLADANLLKYVVRASITDDFQIVQSCRGSIDKQLSQDPALVTVILWALTSAICFRGPSGSMASAPKRYSPFTAMFETERADIVRDYRCLPAS
jgi:hypothetical protein